MFIEFLVIAGLMFLGLNEHACKNGKPGICQDKPKVEAAVKSPAAVEEPKIVFIQDPPKAKPRKPGLTPKRNKPKRYCKEWVEIK